MEDGKKLITALTFQKIEWITSNWIGVNWNAMLIGTEVEPYDLFKEVPKRKKDRCFLFIVYFWGYI